MATTRIIPLHAGKGRTAGKAISDIIDYVKNPDKTDHGRLITSYQCDGRVADAQFLLDKQTYVAYRKAGYSRKFYAEHENEIRLHQAAKEAFNELNMKKLPTIKELQTEYAQLLADKKTAYGEYRQARAAMRELLTVKNNVDRVLAMEQTEPQQKEKDYGQR